MKIGIDARLWNETGVGRYIRNLILQIQLVDTTNDYVLFVRGRDYERIKNEELRITGKRWKVVKTDIHWHTLEEQLKFPKLLEKEKLDVMHFPYFSVPIFYKRPYVVTIHDLILHNFSTGKASTKHPLIYHGKRLGYKYIMKKAAENSKKIIAVSTATKQEIIKHLAIPEEKIVVTYEGVALNESRIKNHSAKLMPSFGKAHARSRIKDMPYFLYVGNVYPHKNVEVLIKAFEHVALQNHKVKLVFVGKEDYFYKRLKEYVARSSAHNQIQFLGAVSDEELSQRYRQAQAVVIPSLMEGFGLPGLEAMAQKCLVLASDIPVFHEIYQDAVLYFDPKDPDELAAMLSNVLLQGKAAYQEQVDLSEKRVSFFSWEQMAKETLDVYEEVSRV